MADRKQLKSDLEKISWSIRRFLDRDGFLLENDVHERSITHKLAEHLQCEFKDYNVDCEYNKNSQSPDKQKKLGECAEKIKVKCPDKVVTYETLIYPDIIIHRRGGPMNRCIIEVKTSKTSPKEDCYDQFKLKCYTENTNSDSSGLGYEMGIFIKFITKKNSGSKTKDKVKDVRCYTNGENNIPLEEHFRNLLNLQLV